MQGVLINSKMPDRCHHSADRIGNKNELQNAVLDCKSKYPNVRLRFRPSTSFYFGKDKDAWTRYTIILTLSTALLIGIWEALRLCTFRSRPATSTSDEIVLSASQKGTLARMRVSEQQRAQLSQSDLCPICLDEMTTGVLSMLACDHVFHEVCLSKWMHTAKKPSCPMCKACITSNTELCKDMESSCASLQPQHPAIEIV
eukprot:IDg1391t1